MDEADILAGALRKPKGSFLVALDMRRTEPAKASISATRLQSSANSPNAANHTRYFIRECIVQDTHGPLVGLRFDFFRTFG